MKFFKRQKFDPNKPILVIKLGDKERGWVPSEDHFKAFTKLAKETGISKKFNVLLYNYGIDFQILDTKKTLEECGLSIVDESKFLEFVTNCNDKEFVNQNYYNPCKFKA
jgi:hypothetical protein